MNDQAIFKRLAFNADKCLCINKLMLTIAGYQFSIFFDNDAAFETIAFRTELLRTDSVATSDIFEICVCSDSTLDSAEYHFLLNSDKGYIIVKEWNVETIRYLSDNVCSMISMMLEPRGLIILHSAVVGNEDVGVLIGGRPYAGKTTLALSALDYGMNFLADDKILLDSISHRAYPLTSIFTIKNDTEWLLPRIFKATKGKKEGKIASSYSFSPFKERFRQCLPIRAIVLPIRKFEAEPILKKISVADIFAPIVFSGASVLDRKDYGYIRKAWKALSKIPSFTLNVGKDLSANVCELNKIFDIISENASSL